MSGLRYSKAPPWVCKAPFGGEILSTVAQYPSPKHSAVSASLVRQSGLIPPRVFPVSVLLRRLSGNETGCVEAGEVFYFKKPSFSHQLPGPYKTF